MAALLGPVTLAQAQVDERLEMLRGGAPEKGVYNLLGFDGTGLGPKTVPYQGKYAPGTIVIDTAKRGLYLVQEKGSAIRYGIGVGRAGFQWKGTHRITAKKENPPWTPPPEMIARQPDVPRHMKAAIRKIRSARTRCTSAARSTGSTAFPIPTRSVRRNCPAVSG